MTTQPRQTYYSVVRYVSDPVRNEARNVGVIVICPDLGISRGKFLLSRASLLPSSKKYAFIREIISNLEVDSADSQLALFAEIKPEFTLDRLSNLHHESTNTIQFTQPLPAPAEPDVLLKETFSDFVAPRGGGGGHWSRGAALRVFRRSFGRLGIEHYLMEAPALRNKQRSLPYVFDFGVKNGAWKAVIDNVSLLNQDPRRPEEKAAWMARAWRDLASPTSGAAYLFVETPSREDPRFRRLAEWTEEAGVNIVPSEAARDVADSLATELAPHVLPGAEPAVAGEGTQPRLLS